MASALSENVDDRVRAFHPQAAIVVRARDVGPIPSERPSRVTRVQNAALSGEEQTHCPRCENGDIRAVPPINPESLQEWFACAACGHLWSQRRDRTPHGGWELIDDRTHPLRDRGVDDRRRDGGRHLDLHRDRLGAPIPVQIEVATTIAQSVVDTAVA